MTTSQSPDGSENEATSEPITTPTPTTEPGKTSTNDLLGELESIIGVLEDSTADQSFDEDIFAESALEGGDDSFDPNSLDDGLDIDIPILDDVVPAAANDQEISTSSADNPRILDIARIFEDEGEADDSLEIEAVSGLETALEMESEEESELSLDLDLSLDTIDFDLLMPDFKLTTITEQTDGETNAARTAETISETTPVTTPVTTPETIPETTTTTEANDEHPSQAVTNKPIDIDLLIQEIVDDLIPVMEDQLRKRLSDATPKAIQQLARTLNIP